MAGQLIDLDPRACFMHAKSGASRAGRVDVVRDSTAYAGHYEEAARGSRYDARGDLSCAIEADCDQPRDCIAQSARSKLFDSDWIPPSSILQNKSNFVLVSGARRSGTKRSYLRRIVDDAIAALGTDADPEFLRRLKADRLRELGREEEAGQVEAEIPEEEEWTRYCRCRPLCRCR